MLAFSSSVSYGRNTLLPLSLYPKVQPRRPVPASPWPIFVNSARLKELAPPDALLTRTYGYTETRFWARFEPNQFFRKAGNGTYQFGGGTIVLALDITIYLHDWLDPLENPHKLKAEDVDLGFSIAMSHELDHLLDACDVVSRQVPAWVAENGDTSGLPTIQQKEVKQLRQLLVDAGTGQPASLSDVDYDGWFQPRNIYDTIDGQVVNRFQDSIQNLWKVGYNTLMKTTDSDARHAKVEACLSSIVNGNGKFVVWP